MCFRRLRRKSTALNTHYVDVVVATSGLVRNMHMGRHAKICGWVKSLPSPPVPFPSLPFLSVPLEIGPLSTARESGERCKPHSGVWGKANLVCFSLKI